MPSTALECGLGSGAPTLLASLRSAVTVTAEREGDSEKLTRHRGRVCEIQLYLGNQQSTSFCK